LQDTAISVSREEYSDQLGALFCVAQAINFTVGLDDVFELVHTQLKRVVPLTGFYVALLTADGDHLSVAFAVREDERIAADLGWPASEGLTGVILRRNTTIRTESYTDECQRRELTPAGPTMGSVWMGTALSSSDHVFGAMVVSTDDAIGAYTAAEEDAFVAVASHVAATLERHRLRRALENRAEQLEGLRQMGSLLASSLDLGEVLDLVVHLAADLLHGEAGSLLLLDQQSGDLVFRTTSGPAGQQLIGTRVPAGQGIAGAAFSENRPIISNDTRRDPRWYSESDAQAAFVTRSVIAAPLNARGRAIGVLEVVNHEESRVFTSEDGDLLMSFGAQAAIAIENARLFTDTDQELQTRLQELTTLQYIDRQLNASLDYLQVMTQTLDWALHLTGASLGVIAEVREDAPKAGLRFLARRGYESEALAPLLNGELWPLTEGLIGHTVNLGTTTLVKDPSNDPHYREIAAGMSAQLTVPIKREGRVIGAIALESTDVSSFRDENVASVERLADHAAVAIGNARLFEQATKANEEKTEFISFAAHELKQPMTAIKGYADLLIKGVGGALTASQVQFVEIVRSNVGRMDKLVQTLLDISRIEAGRLRLELDAVDPAALTTEAIGACEPTIAAKNQDLEAAIAQALPTIQADPARLAQVLRNLLENANQYTPEGGTISVSVGQGEHDGEPQIQWCVNDTGIGMSTDEVAQLFTKYFRSPRDEVRAVPGTGLGLVISRNIVQLHGGEFDVESELGHGASFCFSIPVKTRA
jgi:signal transduction histidine kinase